MPKVALLLRAAGAAAEELRHVIELVKGPAAPGFEAEMLEHGLRSNHVWVTREPDGEAFVLVVEADDPRAAFERLEASNNPIARWVRDNVTRLTGFSTATMEPLEPILEWEAPD